MSPLSVVIFAFSLISAVDYLLGNKLGLGAEFKRGFYVMGSLALSMIGMIVIAPWLATSLDSVFDWVYENLHIDPSILATSILANDMGGEPLANAIARDPEIGMFNGLVVGAMMGATVCYTIPLTMETVDKKHHRELALGLLCGVVTVPIGCLVSGLIRGLPIKALLIDLLPLVILAAVIAVGVVFFQNASVKVFKAVGFLVKALIVAGLMIGILNSLADEPVFEGFASLDKGAVTCLNACVVMSGMFPFFSLLSKLFSKVAVKIARRFGMTTVGVMGLPSALAAGLNTVSVMNDMNDKDIMLNAAFLVSPQSLFAGHLAYTMITDKSYVFPVMAGKTVAGIFALIFAAFLYEKLYHKKNA